MQTSELRVDVLALFWPYSVAGGPMPDDGIDAVSVDVLSV